MKRSLWIVVLVLLMSTLAGAQQPGITFIGETNGLLVAYTPGGLNVLADDTTMRYDHLTVSTDGLNLLYTATDQESYAPRLMWLRRDGTSQPVMLTDNFEAYYGAAFTTDGQSVYYVQAVPDAEIQSPAEGALPMMPVNLVRHPLAGEPQVVGTFELGVGCGGGSPYPMDAIYSKEAGFMGNRMILQATTVGVAHSTACNGTGLMLTNPQTGDTQLLSEDFARGSLSPDGTQMAGVRIDYTQPTPSTMLTIIDLTDGEVRPVETAAMPDQVYWAGDGSIYYSTRTETAGNYQVDAEQVPGIGIPLSDVPSYEVSLYRLSIQSGAEEQIYNTSGVWAVGRMRSTFDALYFSLIPDASPWLALITSEVTDPADPDAFEQARRTVQSDIYRLPFASGSAELMREDVQQFVLAP